MFLWNLLSENPKTGKLFFTYGVLILVFVEFTLRAETIVTELINKQSLNPCFCGIYSQRQDAGGFGRFEKKVLILVFVEFTLRERFL